MKFIIKSKDRIEELKKMTYRFLKDNDIEDSDIFIFVSTASNFNDYKIAYPECHIIKGPLGISNIDNFIVDYFDEGEHYVYLNDDIKNIYHALNSLSLEQIKFKELVEKAFDIMVKNNISYGGVYPVKNAFYMMKTAEAISTHFNLITDPFSFNINNKKIKLTNFENGDFRDNTFSDYEKSILHFKDRGALLRFNHYVLDVKYFNGAKTSNRIGANCLYCAEAMMEKYPDFVSSIKPLKKHAGFYSLRLRRNKKSLVIINDE